MVSLELFTIFRSENDAKQRKLMSKGVKFLNCGAASGGEYCKIIQ